ncbi:hypothetical protein D0B54_12135 [Solimonas sp. K1W22B-7]|uniref:hypothetical protein n=1 Tax=Solimonas sp. K1W22B-7 TaxID=2303331 RepID=UPI000E32FFA5|nr:hypothetical protein [Solimonas sp. K1W22B-7]AXQ29394.1 hypothetical protein D0B54_12135 [Solimonas sp. K1W22B-7]
MTGVPRALLMVVLMSGCSYLDPYKNVQVATDNPNDVRRLLPPMESASGPAPSFVGTLPAALEQADARRRGLLQSALSMSNERAAYDALVWTLTPYLLYRAITSDGGATRVLTGGAAVLGAGYGFLNARPKEYEQIHQDGAARIGCLMLSYTRYLYTTDEYQTASGTPFAKLADDLELAINEYSNAADDVVRSASNLPRPESKTSCALGGSSDCRARQAVRDGRAPDRERLASTISGRSALQIANAEKKLTALRGLLEQVDRKAAENLSLESQNLMKLVEAELRAKRPDLKQPGDAADDIKKSIVRFIAAARAESSGQGRGEHREDVDGRLLVLPSSLDKDVKRRMYLAERALQGELVRTRIVLAVQADKDQRTAALSESQGCPAIRSSGLQTTGTTGANPPLSTTGNPPASIESGLPAQ